MATATATKRTAQRQPKAQHELTPEQWEKVHKIAKFICSPPNGIFLCEDISGVTAEDMTEAQYERYESETAMNGGFCDTCKAAAIRAVLG